MDLFTIISISCLIVVLLLWYFMAKFVKRPSKKQENFESVITLIQKDLNDKILSLDRLELIDKLIQKEFKDKILSSEDQTESKFPSMKYKMNDKSTLVICFNSKTGKYEYGQHNAWLAERSEASEDANEVTSKIKLWLSDPLPGYD